MIHIPSRREMLAVLGGAGLSGRVVRASRAETCVNPAASQTEGPYWIDEMLNRSDIRVDPSNGFMTPGLPLSLALNFHDVRSVGCAPLKNTQIDIWQCDASGSYSDQKANRTKGKKFLRGYQVTDANGATRFMTIYPGWYRGRTVHIHVRVRRKLESGAAQNFTAQLFFPDDLSDHIFEKAPYNNRRWKRDVRNGNDMVLHESGEGSILYPQLKAAEAGYMGTLEIGIDFSKQMPEHHGPPPPPGGPGGPSGRNPGFGPPPPPPPRDQY